ncbi:hypothetical protein F0562_021085 [Nyssa sinensis]|uniref:TmcB/TmcC TPR repeats domain-containing protein n=1 Tax=Nyssa sinensis TaxID=561372 RepID=A0A5J5BMK3_9ASTE|nr:hypothetical protein F0562_021085 [Nyssa sinensis]
MLETIPSFSFHNSIRYEDEDSDEEEEEEENDGLFKNSIRGQQESLMEMKGNGLNLEERNMGLNEEMRYLNDYKHVGFEENREEVNTEMYLARGLGLNGVSTIGFLGGGGGGGGGDFIPVAFGRGGGGGGGGGGGIEEHYKRMVEENPGNPLFLRNYAQFLYQSKHDIHKAEEYYSRAILADP